MSKVSLINMLIGFCLLFLSACAGLFVVNQTTLILEAKQNLITWQNILQKSAHGHTGLFAMIHISFALTLPYSRLKHKIKILQTVGLSSGSIAISFLLFIRSNVERNKDFDLLGIIIGTCLSFTLIAIFTHCVGLAIKVFEKN